MLFYVNMKPLVINPFEGQKTVKSNKTLIHNAAFYSKVRHFEGKLSSSHYVIKFPVSGTENYVINGKKYDVKNNSYIITNPGQEVEAFVKSNKDVIGVCVGFTKHYISKLSGALQQNTLSLLDDPNNTSNTINFLTKKYRLNDDKLSFFLGSIKNKLLDETISDSFEEENFYLSLGEAIIENQLSIHSKIHSLPQAKKTTKLELFRRIDMMDQYINDNFTEYITIDDLSKVACLSKYHAIRCYQKIEGISPYQKITTLRIKKAKILLNKGYAITETANMCGFTDYRTFSRIFKKYAGCLPSVYQKL